MPRRGMARLGFTYIIAMVSIALWSNCGHGKAEESAKRFMTVPFLVLKRAHHEHAL